MASVSKSEKVRTLSSRTEYGSRSMTGARTQQAEMKLAAYPPPIVSIHTWARAKTKNSAVTTRWVGFQIAKARLSAGRCRYRYRPKTPLIVVTNRSQVAKAANPCDHKFEDRNWNGNPAWIRMAKKATRLTTMWMLSHSPAPPSFRMYSGIPILLTTV